MDATLIAVLVTVLGDIYMKWRNSRAWSEASETNKDTIAELRTVILEMKAMHQVTQRSVEAANRRIDTVEVRLAMLEEGQRWKSPSH